MWLFACLMGKTVPWVNCPSHAEKHGAGKTAHSALRKKQLPENGTQSSPLHLAAPPAFT
jgi:hypothetical protein